jgi:hypothetical protein
MFSNLKNQLNTQTSHDGQICPISGSGNCRSRPRSINQFSIGTKRPQHRTKESVQLQATKRLSATTSPNPAIIRMRRFQSQTRLCIPVMFESVFLRIVSHWTERLRSLSISPNLRVSIGSSGVDHSIQTGSQRAGRATNDTGSDCPDWTETAGSSSCFSPKHPGMAEFRRGFGRRQASPQAPS